MYTNHILHKNDFGGVLRCSDCKRNQLTFGNVAMLLNDQKFIAFVNRICDFCNDETVDFSDPERNFFIDTNDEAIAFIFKYHELLQFKILLSQAAIVLQARRILSK